MSIASGADPTGRFIVGRGYPEDGRLEQHVVIWHDGEPTPVAMPGVDQLLEDVNSSGVAVGVSFDPDTWEPLTPWVYRDGGLSALPGVESGSARGINDRGDVAGVRLKQSAYERPVWWPAGAPDAVDLPLPPDAIDGAAYDIDEDGTIVGQYTDDDRIDHAYVWLPDGSAHRLPIPGGTGPLSRALTIRNGWITGLAQSGGSAVALRWHLGSGDVREIPRFYLFPEGANAHGWMVGSDSKGTALLLFDDGDLPLPGLSDVNEPSSNVPSSLSDDGRTIAGYSTDADGLLRAVRWRCR